MHRRLDVAAAALAVVVGATACFPFLESRGGGQTSFVPPRVAHPDDVAAPPGYRVELVAEGLTFPTGIAFDRDGTVLVTESGYAYGEVFTTPRLLRLDPDGSTHVVLEGDNPPWNGVDASSGTIVVAEGGVLHGGRLLRIDPDGSVTALVADLPSQGDHHTNAPLIVDGWVYFAQGVVTNSGVVGLDNHDFGWLDRHPSLHDVPCEDVVLAGRDFETADPRTGRQRVATGAFRPFGTPSTALEVVPGALPCSGAIMRVPLAGGALELVAWGFRNPFGLALDRDGTLLATDNLYDDRGSRGVFSAGDLLWRVESGRWYGWPDFHGDRPLTDDDRYRPPGRGSPGFVLAEHPGSPPEPAAVLAVHSSSNGIDVDDGAFGFAGQAFVAQFGDMAPGVGRVLAPPGFRVVRVDVATGVVEDFLVNRHGQGPASLVGGRGLERPVALRFDPGGRALYVVDFGVMTVSEAGPVPVAGTGVIWRVTRDGAP